MSEHCSNYDISSFMIGDFQGLTKSQGRAFT